MAELHDCRARLSAGLMQRSLFDNRKQRLTESQSALLDEALSQSGRRLRDIEALRAVGLPAFADEEMDELTRRSLGEPKRLYALSSVYAQESRHHLALRILRRHFQAYARSGLASLPRAFWEMYYPLGWRAELT